MSARYSPLVLVCLVSALSAAMVGYAVWQYQSRAGSRWLTVTQSGLTLWGLGQGLSLFFVPLWLTMGWYTVSLVGMLVTPVAWLHFGVRYTGNDGMLTPIRSALLWLPVPLLLVLVATNAGPAVFVDPHVQTTGTFVTEWGPAAYALFGYGYATNLAGQGLLLAKAVRSRNIYRRRTMYLVIAGFILILGHVASLAGLSPFPHFVLVPTVALGIQVSSAAILYNQRVLNLLRFDPLLKPLGKRFSSLAPLARDAVMEEIGSGVIVLDEDNRIVDLNPSARRLLGAEGDRIVGTRVTDVVDSGVFVRDEASFLDSSVTDDTFSNVWVEYQDGTRRCYDFVITGLQSTAGGDSSGRVAIIHDVTTLQRQKRQLEVQKRELERQNEQLEEFASIVSHDLRNPLNVAQGRIELAADTDELDHLHTADTALERMESIIDDVLTLARQGRSIDETEPVELSTVAEHAWKTVDTADASLDVDVRSDVTLDADPTRLQQLLENLFRNAVEHGSADVSVRISTLEGTTGLFAVEDDGPGIPESEREAVLEQGYTTSDDGLGFGLSIVSTIAGAHGWEVTVAESANGGARFEFTLAEKATDQPVAME